MINLLNLKEIIFYFLVFGFIFCFIFSKKIQRKNIRYFAFASITFVFILLLYLGHYFISEYPLINSFVVVIDKIFPFFHFYPCRGLREMNRILEKFKFCFPVTMYGVIIFAGAFTVYKISNNNLQKEFKENKDIFNGFVFIVLFGLLGGKFWDKVFLEENGANFLEKVQLFLKSFFKFEGGISIIGGVLFGSIAFFIYFKVFYSNANLRKVFDLIAPCILIAQAIGRWGNFFNREIYGEPSDFFLWKWLPKFIQEQMKITDVAKINHPLFLIEGFLNLTGYFVIVFLIGKKLKKYLSDGDLGCLYFVWYGLIRFSLEFFLPRYDLRNEFKFNSSSALIMFFIGLIGIIILHIYSKWKEHKLFVDKNKVYKEKN